MVSPTLARTLCRRALMAGVRRESTGAAGAAGAAGAGRAGRRLSGGGTTEGGGSELAGRRKGVQITVGDSQTYSKKCDPYEQGGKPLTKEDATKLWNTVPEWKLSDCSTFLERSWDSK
eukprot:714764-Hanusia_phi.AAC.2